MCRILPILTILIGYACNLSEGITCYECTSTNGQDCKMSSATCTYGFFGCMKVATYSGGVDKLGNFYNQDSRITGMIRGCTVLPLGGVDACQQHSILGYRIVTCYCFTDYCNGAAARYRQYSIAIFSLVVFLLLKLMIYQ